MLRTTRFASHSYTLWWPFLITLTCRLMTLWWTSWKLRLIPRKMRFLRTTTVPAYHSNSRKGEDLHSFRDIRLSYNVGRFWYLVAAWSARRARPHSIIEDEELCEILTMLNPVVKIHSHQTVSHNISDMYHCSHTTIALYLQSIKQRLHIALDGWTAPNVFSFLGVTVQYFDEGQIHSLVLDFVKYGNNFHFAFSLWLGAAVRMSGRHTGKYLAHELEALLRSFGIEKKVHLLLAVFCLETYLYLW